MDGKMKTTLWRFLPLLLLLCLLTACAGMTTRHLPRKPFHNNTVQSLEMRYVTFQYHTQSENGTLSVRGEVFPDVTQLPDWASWYDEIYVAIYLVDDEGRVLDTHETTLTAQPLNREGGFPVLGSFELGTYAARPLHLTFGYKLSLTDAKPNATPAQRRTFVSETALLANGRG